MSRPARHRSRSLLWRVFGSYLVVVAVTTIGALVASEAFAPFLHDRHIRSMGPMMGHGGDPMAAAQRSSNSRRRAIAREQVAGESTLVDLETYRVLARLGFVATTRSVRVRER